MWKLGILTICIAGLAKSGAAEPFRQVLTSTSQNIHIESVEIQSRTVTPNSPVPWSVRKFILHGGKQEGVDVIVVDNGKLQFTVVPTRGMGVLSVAMGDVRLGWNSPVQEVVHPRFINLQSRGGLGWLEGFNEWLCRCGLESNGHPGTDKFINNVGDEATMELTLHGKIANLPAQEVEVIIDREPPYRIRLRGRVDERMFYGPNLALQTEISTEPGASSFRLHDEITNHGARAQEFQILYHTNYGRLKWINGADRERELRSPLYETSKTTPNLFDALLARPAAGRRHGAQRRCDGRLCRRGAEAGSYARVS